MPRKARLIVPGAIHHVIGRRLDHCRLYPDDSARGEFPSIFEKYLHQTGTRCYAWALMNNRDARASYCRFLEEGMGGDTAGNPLVGMVRRSNSGTASWRDTGSWVLGDREYVMKAIESSKGRRLRISRFEREGGRFDAIMLDDTAAMLAIFHHLLSDNGTLFVADLESEDGTFHRSNIKVHHGFERAALQRQTAAAGFAGIQFYTIFAMERTGADGVRRSYPIFLMTARKR